MIKMKFFFKYRKINLFDKKENIEKLSNCTKTKCIKNIVNFLKKR